jgi:alpha-beta hydrolase superfamily lysophospholipase
MNAPHPSIRWLLLGWLCAAASQPLAAADLEREARIAAEIADTVLEGEPVYLEAAGRDFLAILTPSDVPDSRDAVLILHGRGLHPDWQDVVYPLRTELPRRGWHSLSIQLPVLDKEAKYYDYVEIFPEALPRIDAALAYLRDQGMERVVMIAHSCGAHMGMAWVEARGDGDLAGFIGIGMGATDYKQPMRTPFPLQGMRVPVLDVFGGEDYPAVQRMAPERLAALRAAGHPQSAQRRIDGADHEFHGSAGPLLDAVGEWLEGLEQTASRPE